MKLGQHLRKAGASNSSIEERGFKLPLYEMNCKFISTTKHKEEIISDVYSILMQVVNQI